jgi:hypothetical protein
MIDTNILNKLDTGEICSLDLFELEHNLLIVTIKVECPKCGHRWGIKVEDFESLKAIPKNRFSCTECLK